MMAQRFVLILVATTLVVNVSFTSAVASQSRRTTTPASTTTSVPLLMNEVTVAEQDNITLPCPLSPGEKRIVFWSHFGEPKSGIHSLFAGSANMSKDARFSLQPGSALHIAFARREDSGFYSCSMPRKQPMASYRLVVRNATTTVPETADWPAMVATTEVTATPTTIEPTTMDDTTATTMDDTTATTMDDTTTTTMDDTTATSETTTTTTTTGGFLEDTESTHGPVADETFEVITETTSAPTTTADVTVTASSPSETDSTLPTETTKATTHTGTSFGRPFAALRHDEALTTGPVQPNPNDFPFYEQAEYEDSTHDDSTHDADSDLTHRDLTHGDPTRIDSTHGESTHHDSSHGETQSPKIDHFCVEVHTPDVTFEPIIHDDTLELEREETFLEYDLPRIMSHHRPSVAAKLTDGQVQFGSKYKTPIVAHVKASEGLSLDVPSGTVVQGGASTVVVAVSEEPVAAVPVVGVESQKPVVVTVNTGGAAFDVAIVGNVTNSTVAPPTENVTVTVASPTENVTVTVAPPTENVTVTEIGSVTATPSLTVIIPVVAVRTTTVQPPVAALRMYKNSGGRYSVPSMVLTFLSIAGVFLVYL